MLVTVATPFPNPRGIDHEHYDWAPLNARRVPLRWPENARVALCVLVTPEHLERCDPSEGDPWSRQGGRAVMLNCRTVGGTKTQPKSARSSRASSSSGECEFLGWDGDRQRSAAGAAGRWHRPDDCWCWTCTRG
jgi:hypothetical protein